MAEPDSGRQAPSHDSSKVFIQHLFEQEIVDWSRDTGIATFRMYLPDTSPSQEYFQAWVRQSVNRAAQDFYHAPPAGVEELLTERAE
jgi:hypothetical protein